MRWRTPAPAVFKVKAQSASDIFLKALAGAEIVVVEEAHARARPRRCSARRRKSGGDQTAVEAVVVMVVGAARPSEWGRGKGSRDRGRERGRDRER